MQKVLQTAALEITDTERGIPGMLAPMVMISAETVAIVLVV